MKNITLERATGAQRDAIEFLTVKSSYNGPQLFEKLTYSHHEAEFLLAS
jgi:hypothetical protein